ncbi:MAG: hypothetical protein K5673_09290 [Lachnospiraceae bacterium]|jgi:hypothetical protein|nr:hypothetical protein [Lachnospiraceae bacterium]
MEILGIIALLVIVGFLIRILGRAVMNIGISLGVIILVIALLTGLSAMGFF